MRKLILVLCFLASNFTIALSQSGTIRGIVTDAETGEPLIGATVLIQESSSGTATDLDGKYTLQNVEPGTHELQVSYVSYQPKTVSDVEVKTGEVLVMNVTLNSETIGLQEVVVEARAERSSEAAILTLQKKAPVVMDAISSQQFSRSGDNDAAAAIRRVTGVSVEGGKYVYVRGLGDRYSKTTLNNVEIPGLDPTRNAVQMDLFPSNLLDNLMVYKTFSPDLPADFSGGYVSIVTKDFPDRFTFQWNSTLSYNTNASLNDNFLTYNGSSTDWLGYDNGFRDIPGEAIGDIPTIGQASGSDVLAQRLDRVTKSFNKIMAPGTGSTFLNQRHSLSLGNQIDVAGKPLGFIFGLSYQYDNEFYADGKTGRYSLSTQEASGLSPLLDLSDAQGTTNVLLGGLFNLSYKLSSNHKISLNLMRNQSGTSIARYQEGLYPQNFRNDGSQKFQTRTLQYLERSLSTAQLKGEHVFGGLGNLRLDWHSAYTISAQDEPDIRFFANDYTLQGQDTVYSITPSVYRQPSRFYRYLDETNIDNKINFTVPFKQWAGLTSEFKFGASAVLKDRTFRERRLTYIKGTSTRYNGSISDYLADENIGIIGENRFGYVFGPVIDDQSQSRNSYDANQQVYAVYLMTDLALTEKFKFNGGARMEITNIEVESQDANAGKGKLENTDILPAANLIYQAQEDMNVRLSYSKTLARPTFREIAPFSSFDFVGDFVLVGNPDLKRTLIDNYDLRWEMYPSPNELFSVSLFYKSFLNPIEKVIDPRAQNTELSFRNVPSATTYGAELEFKKNLGFVSPFFENFQLGSNVAIVRSRVDISERELILIRAVDPEYPSTRQLFAQSPYLINAFAGYNNPESGTDVNLSFNVFGERLVVVSAGATPDVYEQPRPSLNFSARQFIGRQQRVRITLRANNLLNPYYNLANVYNGQAFPYQKYKLGRDFSLGITYLIE